MTESLIRPSVDRLLQLVQAPPRLVHCRRWTLLPRPGRCVARHHRLPRPVTTTSQLCHECEVQVLLPALSGVLLR